jgi:CheY-like chemotaxis protein
VQEQSGYWNLDCQLSTYLEAEELLGQAPFSVVLVDDGPAAEGLELVSSLRLRGQVLPPVIVITPRTRRLSPDTLSKLEAAATLVRPVRPSQLYAGLVTALAGGSPLAAAEAQAVAVTEASIDETPIQNDDRPTARILVAEDNPTNQRVVLHLLQRLGGYRADFAANGVEVLQALERNPSYALILMDCQMPEMDGYQTTREIRRRELESSGEVRHMPIIALTAGAFQEDRDLCLEVGMDDYLAKPVRRNELREALLRWVNHNTRVKKPS